MHLLYGNNGQEDIMNPASPQQVAIVTDSTADLPLDLINKYGIHVIPLYLIMSGNTWRDGVDISPAKFYELLKTSPDFPKTSQPNEADFEGLFSKLSREADGIVAVLISNELSGTVASALAARAALPDIPIEIVDSRGVSMMEGYVVLSAARAAAQGEDLQSVAAAARALIGRTHVYFIVDTFEYLYRGGRIGAAVKFLGSALNIKPVLEIDDGVVKPLAQVRTRHKALNKVNELLEKQISPGQKIHISVINVAAAEDASRLKDELVARFQPVEIYETDCSPVLGAHVGPGTVGVAFYIE